MHPVQWGRDMRLGIRGALIACALGGAGFGLLATAWPAAAADCGTAGHPPCANRTATPKPAAPKSVAPKPAAAERTAKPRRDEPARTPMRDDDEPASKGAAIDIMLSKIPDIIVPEPKAKTEPNEAAGEPEPDADVEAAPLPPPRSVRAPPPSVFTRSHGVE